MHRIIALAGLLAALTLPMGAAAQSPDAPGQQKAPDAPAQGKAMGKDEGMGKGRGPGAAPSCAAAMRELCPDTEPRTKAFHACLLSRMDQLPERCRGGGGRGSGLRVIQNACKDDVAAHCADVTPQGGELGRCLQAHRDELSESCRGFIDLAKVRRKGGAGPGGPPGNAGKAPAPQKPPQGKKAAPES